MPMHIIRSFRPVLVTKHCVYKFTCIRDATLTELIGF